MHILNEGCENIFPPIIVISEFIFNTFIIDTGNLFWKRMMIIFHVFSKKIDDFTQAKMLLRAERFNFINEVTRWRKECDVRNFKILTTFSMKLRINICIHFSYK